MLQQGCTYTRHLYSNRAHLAIAPSVFVLFPVGCVALCNATLNKDRVQFLYLMVAVIFWLTSFVIVYLQSLEEIGNRQYFIDGWGRRADAFMPWGWRTVSWLYSKITHLSGLPLTALP